LAHRARYRRSESRHIRWRPLRSMRRTGRRGRRFPSASVTVPVLSGRQRYRRSVHHPPGRRPPDDLTTPSRTCRSTASMNWASRRAPRLVQLLPSQHRPWRQAAAQHQCGGLLLHAFRHVRLARRACARSAPPPPPRSRRQDLGRPRRRAACSPPPVRSSCRTSRHVFD
jgi:hypothetical protein